MKEIMLEADQRINKLGANVVINVVLLSLNQVHFIFTATHCKIFEKILLKCRLYTELNLKRTADFPYN